MASCLLSIAPANCVIRSLLILVNVEISFYYYL